MKPKVIDLFCGIGGFSKGFEMAGFDIVLGVDNWDIALETFQKNHNNTTILEADIREVKDDVFRKYKNIDVIIAGPPCQGFSMCGKRDIKDKRNTLFEELLRAVKIIDPKIVVIENVVGLISMKTPDGDNVKEVIETKLREMGYGVESKILDSSDYSVPQSRKRIIFIASKIGKIGFPKPKGHKVTVRDALSNLPDVDSKNYLLPANEFQETMANGAIEIYNHEPMKHNDEVMARIRNVPPGGNWRDVPKELYNVGGEHSNNYRRLDPNKPSITLKHAIKSMIIHPWYDRVITAREVARLQSFPDSFIICGKKNEQHQQLANAVPPLLGKAIGAHIIDRLYSINPPYLEQSRLNEYYKDKSEFKFTFIDLFSGIGGFRLAFEASGGKCVFSSDIDKNANENYALNFGEYPKGDITKIKSEDIPDHDILCAGFPCQPFSIAGRRLGFSDTRGTLFFEIERILNDKKPKAFILENVKGLTNHDGGDTFETIYNALERLGYHLFFKILNAKDYGVPQNRERIFIVGFLNNVEFKFPKPLNEIPNVSSSLESNPCGHEISKTASAHIKKHYSEYLKKNILNKEFPLFASEIRPSRCVFRNDGISPCLTAKMGTGGNNIPVLVDKNRRLTIRECLRIQGFPEYFMMKDSSYQSYKQIGNSVAVPLVKLIATEMVRAIL